jgi:hypothetical protein
MKSKFSANQRKQLAQLLADSGQVEDPTARRAFVYLVGLRNLHIWFFDSISTLHFSILLIMMLLSQGRTSDILTIIDTIRKDFAGDKLRELSEIEDLLKFEMIQPDIEPVSEDEKEELNFLEGIMEAYHMKRIKGLDYKVFEKTHPAENYIDAKENQDGNQPDKDPANFFAAFYFTTKVVQVAQLHEQLSQQAQQDVQSLNLTNPTVFNGLISVLSDISNMAEETMNVLQTGLEKCVNYPNGLNIKLTLIRTLRDTERAKNYLGKAVVSSDMKVNLEEELEDLVEVLEKLNSQMAGINQRIQAILHEHPDY